MVEDGDDLGLQQASGETEGSRPEEGGHRTISQQELDRQISDHKKWVETAGREGECANLSFVDLEG